MNSTPEQIVTIKLPDCECVGLLSRAAAAEATIGVVMIVGGPQTRVGSHRHFVQLARQLAAQGYPALRFDHRGIGDSHAPSRSFEELDDDVAAAIDAMLRARPQLRGVVLWGLCDGASAALLYVARRRDPRVLGLALLNPWVRTAQSEARTHIEHYYGQRLRSWAFWSKVLRGGVGLPQLRAWWQARQRARRSPSAGAAAGTTLPFPALMANGWHGFRGPILLQLAGVDLTAKEFLDTARLTWKDWETRPGLTRHDHADAVHTFAQREHKAAVNAQLLDWLSARFSAEGGRA